jgi:hypothetical protein
VNIQPQSPVVISQEAACFREAAWRPWPDPCCKTILSILYYRPAVSKLCSADPKGSATVSKGTVNTVL